VPESRGVDNEPGHQSRLVKRLQRTYGPGIRRGSETTNLGLDDGGRDRRSAFPRANSGSADIRPRAYPAAACDALRLSRACPRVSMSWCAVPAVLINLGQKSEARIGACQHCCGFEVQAV